jgi:alkaline phosphatase
MTIKIWSDSMRLNKSRISLAILAISALIPAALDGQSPRNVILFIGDGVGISYWTAARFASDELAIEDFKVLGLVDTRSSDSDVTDSAAGATAYSAGIRTYNGAIGVGPDSLPVKTVLELAKEKGMATGLVATSSITHATPASFAAHQPAREMEFEIAADLVEAGVDVLLGGGVRWFHEEVRPDGADLLSPLIENATFVTSAKDLENAPLGRADRLVGLFADNQMPSARDRSPTLPQMTRAAIEVLRDDPDGFFLMVEGSQPDWRGHGNETLERVTAEMLDFDAAVGVATEFQSQVPETLIIVLADHETGGLGLEVAQDSLALMAVADRLDETSEELNGVLGLLMGATQTAVREQAIRMGIVAQQIRALASVSGSTQTLIADYTSPDHTGEMIPLFAKGPHAELFSGIIDNYVVGQQLMELVRR